MLLMEGKLELETGMGPPGLSICSKVRGVTGRIGRSEAGQVYGGVG